MEAITMLLRTLNHLFLWAISHGKLLNNQRVDLLSGAVELLMWILTMTTTPAPFRHRKDEKNLDLTLS